MTDQREKRPKKEKPLVVVPSFEHVKLPTVTSTPGKPGPKPGAAAKLKAIRDALLETDVPEKVLNKALNIAMTDDHPQQAMMLAMFLNRFAPVGIFDSTAAGKTGNMVQVIIPGATQGPRPTIRIVPANQEDNDGI